MTKRLPGFEDVRPPKPSHRDEAVAYAVAVELVNEINIENEFYWNADEKADRVWELAQSIMQGTYPRGVYRRLEAYGSSWRWEGIYDHFKHIYRETLNRHVKKAIVAWKQRYEVRA